MELMLQERNGLLVLTPRYLPIERRIIFPSAVIRFVPYYRKIRHKLKFKSLLDCVGMSRSPIYLLNALSIVQITMSYYLN